MRSKLGISVGLLGAAIYFSGLFSGYLALTLLVGYVLLFESNVWIRRTAVKAFATCMLFSVIYVIISFIPDVINVIDDVFKLFNGAFNINFISKMVILLQSIISVLESVLLLVLGFKALHQGTVPIGIIDELIEEHMKSEY